MSFSRRRRGCFRRCFETMTANPQSSAVAAGKQPGIPHLHVLTLNVHKGFSPFKKEFSLPSLREAIRKTDADIVFLQEVTGENVKNRDKYAEWPAESHYEFLADQIWPHYAYGKNAVYPAGHHGNAILSKYPIHRWETLDISTHRFEKRGLLHVVLEIPEWTKPLHAICVHLGLFSRSRKNQMKMLCDYIEKSVGAGEPVIVAGDFNDWSGRAKHHFSAPSGFREVYHAVTGKSARTFPSWLPVLRLDRIYYRDLGLARALIADREPWSGLSDHMALMAAVDFRI